MGAHDKGCSGIFPGKEREGWHGEVIMQVLHHLLTLPHSHRISETLFSGPLGGMGGE